MNRRQPWTMSRRELLQAGMYAGVGLFLAGCGVPGGAPGTNTTVGGTSGGGNPAPLVFHRSAYRPDLQTKYLTQFEQMYNDKATFDGVPTNYATVTETGFIGGAKWDVVMADEGYWAKWYAAKWLQDLEGLPDVAAHKDAMLPGVRDYLTIDGKLVGLPAWAGTRAFFQNATILKKAGVKPASTWEELHEQAVFMKQKGHSDFPWVPMWTKVFNMMPVMFIAQCFSEGLKASDFFDDKFTPVYAKNPTVIRLLKLNRQFMADKLVPPDILTTDHNATLNAFAAGGSAYFQFNDSNLAGLNDPTKSTLAGNARLMMMPGKTHGSGLVVQAYAMTKNTVDRQRAWNLLRFQAGQAKNGAYVAPKDLFAIELGYASGYKALFQDADIMKAWSKFATEEDLRVLNDQMNLAQSLGAATAQPWYADWLTNLAGELQTAIAGQKEPEAALEATADFIKKKLG